MRRKIILFTVLLALIVIAPYAAKRVIHYIKRMRAAAVRVHKATQADLIRAVVKKNLSQIVNCYNQRIRNGLNKTGNLKIAWDIDEAGSPLNVEQKENQLMDSDLYACSAEMISQWKFPHGIYYKVDYTFHLKQKSRHMDLGRDVSSTPEDLAEVDIE